MFARADIHTAEEIRDLGAHAAYRRLLISGIRPHFIGFYCIYLGLQNRPWNDLSVDEKARLRIEFDALVADVRAEVGDRSAIEAELNKLGVGRRRSKN